MADGYVSVCVGGTLVGRTCRCTYSTVRLLDARALRELRKPQFLPSS